MPPLPETPAPHTRSARVAAGDRAMQRATLIAVGVGLVLDLVVIAVAASRPDAGALNGALLGTGLTLVVVLPSVAIAYLGPRLSPLAMAGSVLGSWAAKMLVVILILLLVKGMPGLSSTWIGLALLVGAVSAMIVEATLLMRTRQPLNVAPVEDPLEPPSEQ